MSLDDLDPSLLLAKAESLRSWRNEVERSLPEGEERFADIVCSLLNLSNQAEIIVASLTAIAESQAHFVSQAEQHIKARFQSEQDLYQILELRNEITVQSDLLGTHLAGMREELRTLISMVEKENKRGRRKRIWSRILKGLKWFCLAVAAVSQLGAAAVPLLEVPTEDVLVIVGVAVGVIAGVLSRIFSKLAGTIAVEDEHEFVKFLRNQMPTELQEADDSLITLNNRLQQMREGNDRLVNALLMSQTGARQYGAVGFLATLPQTPAYYPKMTTPLSQHQTQMPPSYQQNAPLTYQQQMPLTHQLHMPAFWSQAPAFSACPQIGSPNHSGLF